MIEIAVGLCIGSSVTALFLFFAYIISSEGKSLDITARLSDADRDLLQKLVSLLERDNNPTL